MHVAEASSPITVERCDKDGTKRNVQCPPLLPDYLKFMKGIDRGDQLMGYYNVGRRSRKWWKRIFSYLLEVSLLNAYVLQKFSSNEIPEKDFLVFHLALAVELVSNYRRRSLGGRPRSMELAQCLRLDSTKDHLPECVSFKRDCYVCSKVREKKKTYKTAVQA